MAAAAAIGAALGPSAAAQAGSPDDVARADVLFVEGKKLMAEGRHEEACPKLAESQRLDPGGGTAIALALCHEAQGKTATAWSDFDAALALALADGNENRAAVARAHLSKLAITVPRLTVRVGARVAGLKGVEITRDGAPLAAADWAVSLPVDPGEHRIVARSPGYRTRSITVMLAEGAAQTVDVDSLEALPPTAPTTAPAGPAIPWRFVGYALIGAGAITIASGVGLLVDGFQKDAASNAICPGVTCSDDEGLALNAQARVAANGAGIAFGIGAAVAVAGGLAVLLPSSPSAEPKSKAKSAVGVHLLSVGGGGKLAVSAWW